MSKQEKSGRSLYRDVSLALMALMALVVVVFNLANYAVMSHFASARHAERQVEYDSRLSESLELPLWHMDNALVHEIATAFYANKEISGLTILDQQKNVIFQKHKPDEAINEREVIISHNGERMAYVTYGLSRSDQQDRVSTLLITGIGGGLVGLLVILFSLRWILARLLEQPVEALNNMIGAIVKGEYRNSVVRQSYTEFSTIISGVNSIAQAVANREQSLQEANDKLESEIKERKHAEELWLFALEGVGDGVWDWNIAKNTVLFTPRWKKIIGYEDDEFENSFDAWKRSIHPDDLPATMEQLQGYLDGKISVYHPEFRMRCKDGSWKWILARGRLVRKEGETSGTRMIGTHSDISVRKQAEEELLKYRDHLEQLIEERTHELVLTRDAAEAATVAKSEFLASMSHEIRTPMNAILGMLYLALKSSELSPPLRNYLGKAQGAAQSLLAIINDILDISKIEAGKLELELVEFAMDFVLEQLVDTLGWAAEQKGVEFLIRYDVNITPNLVGDPVRLRQVLLNLCGNAIKFTEEGEVELSFQCLNESENELTLEVTVRDTGIGMSQEVQDHLFQKFMQADQSTTRRFGGTGLGLSISKYLVEMMGGKLWLAHSAPNQGSTMRCTMRFAVASTRSISYRQQLIDQVGHLLEGVRVLVVDDNEVSREIMTAMLAEFGISAEMAASGMAALELLEQEAVQPFDLVFMDWRMPVMNGDEVVRLIQTSSRIRHKPPVVVISAHCKESMIEQDSLIGVCDVLTKPVSPSTLLDATLSALGRGRLLSAMKSEHAHSQSQLLPIAGAHLLLVEDNEINREFAHELLASMRVTVDEAENGEEAVTMVKRNKYDGVLMDIQMPVMDGLEATRKIREMADDAEGKRFADLPIIALTAMAMTHDMEKFTQAGMNDYVTKPISPERLKSVLEKWVRVRPEVQARLVQNPVEGPGEADFDDLQNLKSFDVAQGVHRIGDSATAYRKQLHRLRDHYADAIRKLRQKIADEGMQAGKDYCHTLKGLFGNLGATELYACATEMDEQLKQGKMPEPGRFDRMEMLLAQAMVEIGALDEKPGKANAEHLAPEMVQAKLQALGVLMENDLGAAEHLLDDLLAGVAGMGYEQAVREIAAYLDEFDIAAAQARLEQLQAEFKSGSW